MRKYRITRRGYAVIFLAVLMIVFMTFHIAFKYAYRNMENSKQAHPAYMQDLTETPKKHSVRIPPTIAKDHDKKLHEAVYPIENAYVNDGKQIAFLTFDDGPSKNTDRILNILDRCGVKATFFVVGSNAEKNKDILQKTYHDGQAIGNHTYSHKYTFLYKSVNHFINDIQKTDTVLKEILGDNFKTRMVRFPGGSFGDDKQKYKDILHQKGYAYVDWNVVTGDADGNDVPVNALMSRLKATIKKRKHIVVLMHDSKMKSTTVLALPMIIDYLKKSGYHFALLK